MDVVVGRVCQATLPDFGFCLAAAPSVGRFENQVALIDCMIVLADQRNTFVEDPKGIL